MCDCQKTERRETEEKEYHLKNKVNHKIINERNTRMQQINRTDWFSLKLTVREKAKLVIPHRKALRHKHAFIKQSLKHVFVPCRALWMNECEIKSPVLSWTLDLMNQHSDTVHTHLGLIITCDEGLQKWVCTGRNEYYITICIFSIQLYI